MVTSVALPEPMAAVIAEALEGVSGADLAAASARLTAGYRDGTGSCAAVAGEIDVLAYLVARMPATYAAAYDACRRLAAARPDFAPRSLIDLGAGPGTASHAAVAVWPSITDVRMVEPHRGLAAWAHRLAATQPALAAAAIAGVAIEAFDWQAAPADLVIAGYVLAENAPARARALAMRALGCTRGTVLIVEPGTPAGFARIRAARGALVEAGGRVTAPCPHDAPCPLIADDWCHFSVRVPRRRAHRHAKAGDLAYEDERYSYVAVARPPDQTPDPRQDPRRDPLALRVPGGRLLAQPLVRKDAVAIRLCTADGLATRTVPRRDKAGYKAARKLAWGDWIEG